MTCKYWTDEEIAILRDVMEAGASIKQNMDQLPGRSRRAAAAKCAELNIKRQTVEKRMFAMMADGKARTAVELAEAIKATRKHVAELLFAMSIPGDDQFVHVRGSTTGRRPVPIYVIGSGPNNHGYVPFAHRYAAQQAASESDLDQKFKNNGDWWPYADPVVLQSIHAMVSVGQVSA